MITARPKVLRALLARYAEACARILEDDTTARRLRLGEIARTLCAVTETQDIQDAIAAADRVLAEARSDAARCRRDKNQGQGSESLVA
ncbi:DUF5133 domain-containing protein [Streptomyces sp. NPDC096013]|uniref:DUF5133 domain-containing protein n=1 Tax=Streptomyces sp. NPDC096013 TaxID=3366069 RepID=UPI00380C9158